MKAALLLISALVAGCAAPPYNAQIPPTGPTTIAVHIARPFAGFGMVVPAPVSVNGQAVGLLVSGGDLTTQVAPGTLQVSSTSSAAGTTAIAGYEYFFEVTMPAQLWLVVPDFDVRFVSSRPSAAAALSTPTGPAAMTRYAFASENFARSQQCNPKQAAILRSSDSGSEHFDVLCIGGTTLRAACDVSGCRKEP